MKVIDINLIGEYGKDKNASKVKRTIVASQKLDPKTKELSQTLVVIGVILFILAIGSWGYVYYLNANQTDHLEDITKQYDKLKPELAKIEGQQEASKNKKRILELKLVVRDTIDKKFLSWTRVLKEIATSVPKELKITEVIRQVARKGSTYSSIDIKGQINANKAGALRLVSYFVLNINANLPKDSLLRNATINGIKYDDQSKLYKFIVSVDVKSTPKSK